VFRPTITSRALADSLEITPGDTVVDVGCGSGVLAFVAARLGAGRVYGVDVSGHAIEAARRNAVSLGLSAVCEFRQGDLLEAVHDVEATVIIADVSGVPDGIAQVSGWFDDVPPGGPTGAELPTRLLRSIGNVLLPGGRLYLPTGTLQHERSVVTVAHEVFDGRMENLLEREVPLSDVLAESQEVARAVDDGIASFRQRGTRLVWQLRIWRCTREPGVMA
jgi:protein-L-isoaspartate O-methyltransferase